MPGKLYGIGIGPGDPGLVTLKALKLLEAADIICVPRADSGEGSIAFSILHQLLPGKECLELSFPMVRDTDRLQEYWRRAAETVADKLAQGLEVAFVTLGDPLLYSTYNYLLKALWDKAPDIQVETVPGITSFSAAAALANLSLVERDEEMAVLPASAGAETLRRVLTDFDTVVLMKIGHRLAQVRELLNDMGLARDAVLVSRAGLEGQVIARDISQVEGERLGYLSVVIVRRRKGNERCPKENAR